MVVEGLFNAMGCPPPPFRHWRSGQPLVSSPSLAVRGRYKNNLSDNRWGWWSWGGCDRED